MAMGKMYSRFLVVAQLGLFIALLATGPWWTDQFWWVFEAVGVLLVGWSVTAMSLRQMRPMPEVVDGDRLVTHGPYRWIRHPMYTAILLITVGLIGNDPALYRIVIAVALLVILILKSNREEYFLCQAYPDYPDYRKSTWQLIPLIW